MNEVVVAGSLGIGILALAWRFGWLTPGGVAAAVAVGAVVLAGTGAAGLGLLLAFFVSASLLTRLGGPGKPAGGREHRATDGGSGRSASQVLANGGAAAAAASLGLAGRPELGQVALLGALAAATADTWATELGTLVRGTTRRITTWREVPPGTSGGISWPGSLGGLAGAAALGVAAGLLDPGGRTLGAVALALGGGGVGMATDSLLGATLEGRVGWVDNDVVNLVGTIVGALVALGLGFPPG